MNNKKVKKAINFDLIQEELKNHYPKKENVKNPLYYKKAYSDINKFMEKNRFKHRQYSGYESIEKMSKANINLLLRNIVKELPWINKVAKEIDVTNIDEERYSAKPLLEKYTVELEYNKDIHLEKKMNVGKIEDNKYIKNKGV